MRWDGADLRERHGRLRHDELPLVRHTNRPSAPPPNRAHCALWPNRFRSRPRLSLCCDFAGFRAGLPPVPLSGAFRSALPRGAFDESADSAAPVGVYRIPHPEDFWYPLRHGIPPTCVCLSVRVSVAAAESAALLGQT
jgi:hypothetical protein